MRSYRSNNKESAQIQAWGAEPFRVRLDRSASIDDIKDIIQLVLRHMNETEERRTQREYVGKVLMELKRLAQNNFSQTVCNVFLSVDNVDGVRYRSIVEITIGGGFGSLFQYKYRFQADNLERYDKKKKLWDFFCKVARGVIGFASAALGLLSLTGQSVPSLTN